jgi:hypothetical protein
LQQRVELGDARLVLPPGRNGRQRGEICESSR